MTEPTIINGVDVSNCEFIKQRNNLIGCMTWVHNSKNIVSGSFECQQNPNCYYKQLKRTQQELQQAMDNYVQAINYYEDKLAQIKRIINEVENE